jgi:hypothetical protein
MASSFAAGRYAIIKLVGLPVSEALSAASGQPGTAGTHRWQTPRW